MKLYQTKLIPALRNGLNALSDEVGRPVRGENVLLLGLQRAIDRRVSIEALLDASADFIGLHGLSEQSLLCLAASQMASSGQLRSYSIVVTCVFCMSRFSLLLYYRYQL
eukprot:scaffold199_cov82-Skeletonema_marinoi.AAC.1